MICGGAGSEIWSGIRGVRSREVRRRARRRTMEITARPVGISSPCMTVCVDLTVLPISLADARRIRRSSCCWSRRNTCHLPVFRRIQVGNGRRGPGAGRGGWPCRSKWSTRTRRISKSCIVTMMYRVYRSSDVVAQPKIHRLSSIDRFYNPSTRTSGTGDILSHS